MVYFFDGNNPGVLYCGTAADVKLLRQHGGSPKRWAANVAEGRRLNPLAPAVGSTITVLTPEKEEQWPVERANFAKPWW